MSGSRAAARRCWPGSWFAADAATAWRNYRTNARRAVQLPRLQVNRGEAACQCFAGRTLDAFVTDLVLAALRPSTIEVSLQLAEDIELERAQQHRHWTLRLERALRGGAGGAPVRPRRTGEPAGRADARKRWEEALATKAELEAEHAGSWPVSLPS